MGDWTGLLAKLVKGLALSSNSKYARKVREYMEIYRSGTECSLVRGAQKKYKSHRRGSTSYNSLAPPPELTIAGGP
jgi:hypothetical protein